MQRMLLTLYAGVLIGALQVTLSPSARADEVAGAALAAQLAEGQALYAFNCAVCHGAQGLGLAEARLAFPADHQNCEWCHKPHNPRQMTLEQMTPHNAFSVGKAPPLSGAGTLGAFPNALALYSYSRATMPRFEPARHSDEEYLAMTAYILSLRGELNDVLTFEALADTPLSP
jgi:mono/diheme cytochrome c family protein